HGRGHEKTYHHCHQERHSIPTSSQSLSTQSSTMEPPRRPGGGDDEPRSHWIDPGYCKYYPGTAPMPHPSKITRIYPAPTLLVQRQKQQQQQQNALANEGEKVPSWTTYKRVSLPFYGDSNDGRSNDPNSLNYNNHDAGAAAVDNAVNAAHPRTKRKNREKVDDEDRCPICRDLLQEENRGIAKCGHVFCLACILQWVKKQQNSCPTCRAEVRHIKRTISLVEALEKSANRKTPTKAKLKRAKMKSAIGKPSPNSDITTAKIRVRKKVSREQIRQNAMAPHPQAPGGFLHAQGQAEAATEAEQALPDAQPDQVVENQEVAFAVFSTPSSATPRDPSPLPSSSPPSPAADLQDRRAAIEADRRALFESTSALSGHRGVGGGSYVGGGGGARSIDDGGGGVGVSVDLDVRMENNNSGDGGGNGGGGRGWRSTVSMDNSSSGVRSDADGFGSGNRDTDNNSSSSRSNNGVRTGGAAEAAAQESGSTRDVQGAVASSGGETLDHDDDDDGRGEGVGNIATLGGLLSVLGSGGIRVSSNGGTRGGGGGGGGAAAAGGGGVAAVAPSSDPFSSLLRSYGSSSSSSSSSSNNNSVRNSSHGVGNPAIDPETRSAAQAAMAAIRAVSRYTSLVPAQALAVQGLAALESSPTPRQLHAVARPIVGGSAWAGMAGAPALAGVSQRRQRQGGLGQDSGEDRDNETGVSGRGDDRKSSSEARGSLLPRVDSDASCSDSDGGNGVEDEPCTKSVARRAAVGERDVGHMEERDEYAFPGGNDNDSAGGTTGSASPILSGSSAAVADGSSTSIPEGSARGATASVSIDGSIDGANTPLAGAEDACGDFDGAGGTSCDHGRGGNSVGAIGVAGHGGDGGGAGSRFGVNSGRVHAAPLNNSDNNNNTPSYLTWLESRSGFNLWSSLSSDNDDDHDDDDDDASD
ncbi:unnamed protein product, partial [Ectocarpus fasciculatus]